MIESLLNALGWIDFKTTCSKLDWRRLAEYLPRLSTPLLGEYAIATLGECGDPSMISYLEKYRDHPEFAVRAEAEKAIQLLKRP